MRSCAPPRREDSAPQERRARSHEAAGYRHRAPPFITIPAIPNSQCLQGQRIPPGFRTADTLPVRSGRLYRRHARGRAGRGQARRQWIRSSVRPEPAHDRRIPGNMSVAEPGSEMLVLPGHRPRPPWRYPHGPVQGEIPGKNRLQAIPPLPPGKPPSAPLPGARLPTGYRTHGPRPRVGRGRSAGGAGGVGGAREMYRHPSTGMGMSKRSAAGGVEGCRRAAYE